MERWIIEPPDTTFGSATLIDTKRTGYARQMSYEDIIQALELRDRALWDMINEVGITQRREATGFTYCGWGGTYTFKSEALEEWYKEQEQ